MAGMQVFSDSFRDTKVKIAPGMENEVPEAPWECSGDPGAQGPPAKLTHSTLSPLLNTAPHQHTHPKLAALISLTSQRKQNQKSKVS